MIRTLLSAFRDDRGVSAMEFALVLPILVLLAVGTVEYSRLILLTQKLQNGAFILADLTARDRDLSTEELGHVFLAIDQVIRPFEFVAAGTAVLTSIGLDADGDPEVKWQCAGAGTLAAESLIGAGDGAPAIPPDDLEVRAGEIVIAAEVFYAYAPLTGIGPDPRVIRRAAFFKPRLGDLSTLAACP